MSGLFCDGYPDTPEGHARMNLSMVAGEIQRNRGKIDDDARMNLVIRMHRIDPDDLPERLRRLYHEIATHLGMVA